MHNHANRCKMMPLFLVALLVSQALGQTFLPTTFTQSGVLFRPKVGERLLYNATLCPSALNDYDNLTAIVYFNLPWNLNWRPAQGIIHGRVSNASDFSTITCTNTNSSNMASPSCSYVYKNAMGPVVYIEIVAATGFDTSFTIGLEFVSKKITHDTSLQKSSPILPEDAGSFTSLVPSITGRTGSIPPFDEIIYKFCLNHVTERGQYDTVITVSGTHPNSAFVTTACWDIRCNVDTFRNYEISSDTSYSNQNKVTVDTAAFQEDGLGIVIVGGVGGTFSNEFQLDIRQVGQNKTT